MCVQVHGTLVNLLFLVDAELARTAVDQQEKATDDGQNLEEIVLGKVLVRVVGVELEIYVSNIFLSSPKMEFATYSPEVVDKEVKDAQDDDQKSGAELGLETDNNHDASAGSE